MRKYGQLLREATEQPRHFPSHCQCHLTGLRGNVLTCNTTASQVSLHVVTMAFVVVLCTCGLLIPIMLYVFQVSQVRLAHCDILWLAVQSTTSQAVTRYNTTIT